MGIVVSDIIYKPSGNQLGFQCPGCKSLHVIPIQSETNSNGWNWNSDAIAPTISPSVRIGYFKYTEEGDRMVQDRIPLPIGVLRYPGHDVICHSQITNGKIYFYEDTTHDLVSKTVPLEPHGIDS